MPVNLSVKNVPDALAAALRRRASRHHRSLQGELLAILHAAVASEPGAARGRTTPVAREAPASTWAPLSADAIAPRSESALLIRAARDGRTTTIEQLCDRLAGMGQVTPPESTSIIRKSRSSR